MEKIQELTDKLYREGVEKGNAEGKKLIEQAEQQAAQIVEEARRKAAAIEEGARKQAADLDAHTRAELKMYAAQAVNALKSEVANVLTDKLVADAVGGVMADKTFIGRFMVELVRNWAGGKPLVISSADAESLKSYFMANAKELLNAGLTIQKVGGKPATFTVAPADGSYKVNFGAEEFEAYFKEFLRPALVQMLF